MTRIVGSSPHHDVTYLTDTEGRVLATRSYDPWGVTRTVTGAPSYLGYQGDPTDTDTTLVDMGARSYLPELGRFLTQDPLRGDPMSPLTLNPYIYGWDDPVTMTDPTGMEPCPEEKTAIVPTAARRSNKDSVPRTQTSKVLIRARANWATRFPGSAPRGWITATPSITTWVLEALRRQWTCSIN